MPLTLALIKHPDENYIVKISGLNSGSKFDLQVFFNKLKSCSVIADACTNGLFNLICEENEIQFKNCSLEERDLYQLLENSEITTVLNQFDIILSFRINWIKGDPSEQLTIDTQMIALLFHVQLPSKYSRLMFFENYNPQDRIYFDDVAQALNKQLAKPELKSVVKVLARLCWDQDRRFFLLLEIFHNGYLNENNSVETIKYFQLLIKEKIKTFATVLPYTDTLLLNDEVEIKSQESILSYTIKFERDGDKKVCGRLTFVGAEQPVSIDLNRADKIAKAFNDNASFRDLINTHGKIYADGNTIIFETELPHNQAAIFAFMGRSDIKTLFRSFGVHDTYKIPSLLKSSIKSKSVTSAERTKIQQKRNVVFAEAKKEFDKKDEEPKTLRSKGSSALFKDETAVIPTKTLKTGKFHRSAKDRSKALKMLTSSNS